MHFIIMLSHNKMGKFTLFFNYGDLPTIIISDCLTQMLKFLKTLHSAFKASKVQVSIEENASLRHSSL